MKQILVVDDETAISDGLKALFELDDLAADAAYDREGAEELLDANFYPVVLADLRLHSEEEGLRLLDSIRQRSPRTKIATLTAFATEELEAELKRRGSAVVLRKPMDFDAIVAVVAEMLQEIGQAADEQVARTGQPLDVDQLYHDVRRVLYSIPQRRYGFTAEETDELVQEAWMLFLERQASVITPKSWLSGTIVNLCKQQIQKNGRKRELSRELTSDDEEIAANSGTSHADVLMVRQALSTLDERSRLLCTLIGMEGLSYDEVSETLGIPLGSVGPLYIRAKAKMRKALAVTN